MPGSHSQEHLNQIRSGSTGPVKVVTTGGNVPTQPVSRPVILPPGNVSPKTKRQSTEYAMQLTGKGVHAETGRPLSGTVASHFSYSCTLLKIRPGMSVCCGRWRRHLEFELIAIHCGLPRVIQRFPTAIIKMYAIER